MTRLDALHELYFKYLATFYFDKARELLDKEGNKMNPEFLQHLHALVQYERAYHNFGFIVQKGNLSGIRRDKTLSQCYSDLHMSLIEGQTNQQNMNNDESTENNSIQQLTAGLIAFLSIRTGLMKLYEQISGAVKRNEHNVRLEVYLGEITTISQMDMSSLHLPILQPINQVLKYEIDCLFLLIQSYIYICDYQYLNSVSNLHHMHCVLKEWNKTTENQQSSNSRSGLSSAIANSLFKSSTKSALYTFYSTFHQLLVAKFTLYFTDLLYEYGGVEAKASISKTNPNFTALIAQFHRRSNVEWIVLVLHLNPEKISNTNQIGQTGDSNVNQSATSIDDIKPYPYQIIFGYPTKPHPNDQINEAIRSKVFINKESLISGEKVSYIGDSNQSKTYFLQNIDPRMTLGLVFASHRQERDNVITSFLAELLDLLRGSRQMLYFKNGGK